MIPLDAVPEIHDLLDRPVWEDPPHIVAQLHPDLHDAFRTAWAAEFGSAPVDVCSTDTPLPARFETPSGRRTRDCLRAVDADADLVLVGDSDWEAVWRKAGVAPVYSLDIGPETAA